jgi:hypothetical protein
VWCDTCVCSFCVECIQRNFGGAAGLAAVTSQARWSCYLCAPAAVDQVRAQYAAEASDFASKPAGSKKRGRDVTRDAASPDHAGRAKELPGKAAVPSGAPAAAAAEATAARVVSEDLSLGRERNILLRCVNEVDGQSPPPFVYTAANVDSASVREVLKASRGDPDFLACCSCVDGCADAAKCACQRLSGAGGSVGRATYAHGSKRLVEPRAAVYECNAACACHSQCQNRVVTLGVNSACQSAAVAAPPPPPPTKKGAHPPPGGGGGGGPKHHPRVEGRVLTSIELRAAPYVYDKANVAPNFVLAQQRLLLNPPCSARLL